jgi:tRNA U34 5-methylaminomethyl-2-thiouridine-forming methyltransferase MnmC
MKKILTADGSITYYNEDYDETYHSKTGAIEESERKFAEPAGIKKGMKILDICFGLGYNSMAAMKKAKKLSIVGLEKDREILKKIQKIKVKGYEKEYGKVKNAAKNLFYKDKDAEMRIIIGDATKTIKELDRKFDAVFLDPFSPPKNPELWTEKFLKEVKKRMKKGARLTTYSCARVVRDNLKEAGFKVYDGPKVGRRGPSTVAVA